MRLDDSPEIFETKSPKSMYQSISVGFLSTGLSFVAPAEEAGSRQRTRCPGWNQHTWAQGPA